MLRETRFISKPCVVDDDRARKNLWKDTTDVTRAVVQARIKRDAAEIRALGCGGAAALRCEVCGESGQDFPIDRHHLLPRAAGGRGALNLVGLCMLCHRLAHRLYGEGHTYTGPTEARPFIEAMRAEIKAQETRRYERWPRTDTSSAALHPDHAAEKGFAP